ncbi:MULTISPECIES: HAD family hydrolase [unclassified Streptococcus]|uniref:HAD family hydrolase n=1 Tax=unclassified Streptococcus TaxID=2608887 RepID=UPI0039850FC7
MNQQKYAFKNYIFDFYGTLVDIETDESSPVLWETMAKIYQSYGAHYTGESLQVRYKELVKQAEQSIAREKQVTYPEIDLTVILVQLYLESHPTGASVHHLKEWGRLIARTFRVLSRKRLELYPHTKEVLEDMKAEGCRIYLLSNAQADFTNPEIDLVGLREFFHDIYLSSDAGICKPQREFLMKVIKEHQLNPDKTVMVGNDFTTDVAVAKSIGMQSILINTFPYSDEELQNRSQAGVSVIRDIQELQEDKGDYQF